MYAILKNIQSAVRTEVAAATAHLLPPSVPTSTPVTSPTNSGNPGTPYMSTSHQPTPRSRASIISTLRMLPSPALSQSFPPQEPLTDNSSHRILYVSSFLSLSLLFPTTSPSQHFSLPLPPSLFPPQSPPVVAALSKPTHGGSTLKAHPWWQHSQGLPIVAVLSKPTHCGSTLKAHSWWQHSQSPPSGGSTPKAHPPVAAR